MNKKKQTMIYPFLLPMNVVDTMFHVAGLYEAMVFRDGCVQRLSGKHESLAAASFFFCCAAALASIGSLAASFFFSPSRCLYRQGQLACRELVTISLPAVSWLQSSWKI
jgi:uncharacterized membrane protein